MSLRKLLIEEIQKRGYMTINEVHAFVKSLNHKESNAERRLRESESPEIETVRNSKGHNIGYKMKVKDNLFDLKPMPGGKDLIKYL